MSMKRCEYRTWIEPCYKNLTLAERKERILDNLEAFRDCKDYEQYHGYAPLFLLKSNICIIMGWVYEASFKRRGGYTTYVYEDLGSDKLKETIRRMVEQGFIEISQSGKGFKVLKTK